MNYRQNTTSCRAKQPSESDHWHLNHEQELEALGNVVKTQKEEYHAAKIKLQKQLREGEPCCPGTLVRPPLLLKPQSFVSADS